MAQGALAHAGSLGLTISLCIVDAAGHEVLSLRSDGANWFTVGVARVKARTAAAMRRDTAQLAGLKEKFPELLGLIGEQLPFSPTTLGGGTPLWDPAAPEGSPVLLGGVGVSGASPEQDAECAQTAVQHYR